MVRPVSKIGILMSNSSSGKFLACQVGTFPRFEASRSHNWRVISREQTWSMLSFIYDFTTLSPLSLNTSLGCFFELITSIPHLPCWSTTTCLSLYNGLLSLSVLTLPPPRQCNPLIGASNVPDSAFVWIIDSLWALKTWTLFVLPRTKEMCSLFPC